MKKRKATVPSGPRPNDKWEITTELQINGRYVKPGTELKIKGWPGRHRFVKHVKTEKGVEWIDVLTGSDCFRSCGMDKVKTVHSKNKTDEHLAKEYKIKRKAQLAEAKQENLDQ
jgi:hypothetical protein